MAKKPVRIKIYSLPEPQVTSRSRIVRNSFIKYRSKFIEFDPDYGDAFADDWLALIVDAENSGSDTEIRSVQVGKTLGVDAVMKECRQKWQITKRFVEKAFPGNAAVLNEFGGGEYSGVSHSQEKMIKFLNNLYKVASKYSADLAAAKFTQEQIEEIKTLAGQLGGSNEVQEDTKRERPVETRGRIEKHNKVWKITSKVLTDGKIIFADDPVKKKLFTLQTGAGGGNEGEQAPQENPPAK